MLWKKKGGGVSAFSEFEKESINSDQPARIMPGDLGRYISVLVICLYVQGQLYRMIQSAVRE